MENKKEKELRERIQFLLKKKCKTVNSIASNEAEQRKLNRQINENTTISSETIYKIIDCFPGVNLEWLLLGNKNIPDEECSLYYYTTAETLLKILGDASFPRIKYSNFNNTNDPKERTLYYRHCIMGQFMEETEAKKFMEENYKFLSFCKKIEYSYDINNRVTSPRMWAQYGTKQDKDGKDNKSYMNGACIELDFKKVTSNGGIQGLSFFDVEYKNGIESYNLFYPENETDKLTIENDVKFKHDDWSEEHEFRALYKVPEEISEEDKKQEKDKFFDISDCIKRIYLGADFRHENVVKLCNIMASKRHDNISPFIFTKITIRGSAGLIENDDIGMLHCDMMEIIEKDYPKYYKELLEKYEYNNTVGKIRFEKKLADEKKEDEEKLKLDAEYWRNKYYDKVEESSTEIKELNKEIKIALGKTISLQEKINSLNGELGEVKKDLATGISAASDAQEKTGTLG
jgi:hypothetical protein